MDHFNPELANLKRAAADALRIWNRMAQVSGYSREEGRRAFLEWRAADRAYRDCLAAARQEKPSRAA